MTESPGTNGSENGRRRASPGPIPLPAGSSRLCGRHSECRCAAAAPTAAQDAAAVSDLDSLLARPDFAGEAIGGGAAGVCEFLPLLDESVAITVSGAAVMNDVGHYDCPTEMGGPIRSSGSRICLRLNTTLLDAAVATEPDQYLPPTLRLFDRSGAAAHATYLTPRSDRLAFESLRSITTRSAPGDDTVTGVTQNGVAQYWADADQITQFDSILADGGINRHAALPSLTGIGYRRIDPTRLAAALEHLAYLELPLTMVATGTGCLQLHHDHLIAARMTGNSLTLASGMSRMMIDLTHVAQCWSTVASGVWGPTPSVEMYDARGRCSVVFTQTGAIDAVVSGVWAEIVESLAV